MSRHVNGRTEYVGYDAKDVNATSNTELVNKPFCRTDGGRNVWSYREHGWDGGKCTDDSCLT